MTVAATALEVRPFDISTSNGWLGFKVALAPKLKRQLVGYRKPEVVFRMEQKHN